MRGSINRSTVFIVMGLGMNLATCCILLYISYLISYITCCIPFKENESIMELILSHNNLGDSGVAIGEAICKYGIVRHCTK